jgi:hypothetical protein
LYLTSMLRNKRIVLAYLLNRLEKIQALTWQVGTVDFPPEKREQLSKGKWNTRRSTRERLPRIQGRWGRTLT